MEGYLLHFREMLERIAGWTEVSPAGSLSFPPELVPHDLGRVLKQNDPLGTGVMGVILDVTIAASQGVAFGDIDGRQVSQTGDRR
ncbi:MAG: hypothetical protein AMXMBFR13_24900 [Phycisphaerae bacterium]